jgi:hypothetical protein
MPNRSSTAPGGNNTNLSAASIARDSNLLLAQNFTLLPSMKIFNPKIAAGVASGPQMSPALRRLLNRPPTLTDQATNKFDGRNIPIVLALVRDKQGRTRPGLLTRLLQNGELRDQSYTNARGMVLMRLPPRAPGTRDAVSGTLELLAEGLGAAVTQSVTVPAGHQHTVVEMILDELPELDAALAPVADNITVTTGDEEEDDAGNGAAATTQPALTVGRLRVNIQDNPLDRLPADFSTELCADLGKFLGATEDPILGMTGEGTDFRRRRIPLIKRLTVPRIGINPPGDTNPPKRYLVRVRQQWTFVGYTLGEIANVEALDPGSIVDQTVENVQRVVERVSRSLDTVTSQSLDTTQASLSQASSIDALLQVSTSVSAMAGAAGFFLPSPIPIFGGGGAARVSTTATTRSSVNTSLMVNSGLHVAKSLINQAQRTVQSTMRDVQSTVTRAVGQVSPLLSRVTNLLRWTLYENYVVCTHIEDVVEVQSVPVTASLGAGTDVLFDDESIVEYRRVFEPVLLEPRLRPHFETLRRAVAQKRAATMPASVVHVTVDYAAVFARGTLRLRVNGEPDQFVTLRMGGSRATESVRLSIPVPMPLSGTPNPAIALQMELSVEPDYRQLPSFVTSLGVLPEGSVSINGVRVRVESSPGNTLEMTREFGSDFRATTASGSSTVTQNISVRVPPPAVFTQGDPLFVHINQNRHYYFGQLVQAALADPALRDDAPQLSIFNGEHDLWRLPIIGFEGHRALVIGDPDTSDPTVKADLALFNADAGAATVIQLAAPGAYAEALQGLLKLDDALGKLHPKLLPLPAPVLAPVLPVTGLPGGTGGLLDGGLTNGSGGTTGDGLLGGGLPGGI